LPSVLKQKRRKTKYSILSEKSNTLFQIPVEYTIRPNLPLAPHKALWKYNSSLLEQIFIDHLVPNIDNIVCV
jgi:hypothetical protein